VSNDDDEGEAATLAAEGADRDGYERMPAGLDDLDAWDELQEWPPSL
jgi:hypothetical protein